MYPNLEKCKFRKKKVNVQIEVLYKERKILEGIIGRLELERQTLGGLIRFHEEFQR